MTYNSLTPLTHPLEYRQINVRYRDPKTKKLRTMIEDAKAPNIWAVHDVRESYSVPGCFALELMDDFEALEDRLAGRT